MWSKTIAALAAAQVLGSAQAALTFPDKSDEIEALLFQQSGYRSRGFADIVTPCSNEGAPGFVLAAGMVRTAFHDMAEHNAATGVGGLDASIAYELQGDFAVHNSGPAFNATLAWAYNFFNEKASMADLLALGLVTSVEKCGGPLISMKYGRKDAKGSNGDDKLPDAGDSADTLTGRFDAMGFTPQDMIKLVACGHTLGGVHIGPNPAIASSDAARARSENVLVFDDTDSKFDNNVCAQYVKGTTRNPLVVGRSDLASDKRVFEVDRNTTVRGLANSATAFRSACQDVLGRMIDKVPRGVSLGQTIQPYDVKPGQLNANVKGDGPDVDISGEIRIRTTKSNVGSVKIVYKGPTDCKDNKCEIAATKAGTGTGFGGETFAFYGFAGTVSSISSFNVVVDGTTYDNNGQGFTFLAGGNGGAFVQPSSCSLSGGKVTVAVAVPVGSSAVKSSLNIAKRGGGVPSCKLTVKGKAVYGKLPTTTTTNLQCSQTCSDELYTYWACTGNADSNAATYGRLETSLDGKVIDSDRSFSGFPSSGNKPKCNGKAQTSTTSSSSKTSSSSSLTTTPATTTPKTTVSATLTSSTTSGKSTLTSTTKCKGRDCDEEGDKTTTTTKSKHGEDDNQTSSTTKCKGRDCGNDDDHTSTTTKSKHDEDDNHTSTTTKDKDDNDNGHGTKTTTSKDSNYTPPSWTVWDPAPVNPKQTGGYGSGPADAPWAPWNGQKALDEVKSIYRDHALIPAPSGGIDGGNKRTHGLNLHVTVKIIEVTISAPTIIYPGAPQPTWGGADVPVAVAPSTWATAKIVDPTKTWQGADVPDATATWVPVEAPAASSWKPAEVSAASAPAPAKDWENVKPSGTYGAPVAKWTGAANSLVARGELAVMGAAALVGAVVMAL